MLKRILLSKVQESEQEVSRDGKTMENVDEDEAGLKMQGSNKDVASPLEGSDEAVVEVNQEDSTEKSVIDEDLGKDSANASICDSLNVSPSNCHLQAQEQEKMIEDDDNSKDTSDIGGAFPSYSSKGVAQGSKYQHILADSNGK